MAQIREERRRERERERRLEAKDAHGGKKSKLTRDRDRDISEKGVGEEGRNRNRDISEKVRSGVGGTAPLDATSPNAWPRLQVAQG